MDTTSPGSPPLVFPQDSAFINTNIPKFDWVASTGDVFGYRILVVSGNINTGSTVLDAVLTGNVTEFQVLSQNALDEGVHQWQVIARDRALNVTTSDTRTFTVDVTPPGAPGLVAPGDNALLNINTPTLDWNASTGDVSDYILQVTSGNIFSGPYEIQEFISLDAVGTGDATVFNVLTGDALADGSYTWRVIALDKALNTAPSVIRTFTVDTTAPGAPALVSPTDGAFLNDTTPFFDWNASTRDVDTYRLQVVKSGDQFQEPFVINSGDITQTQFQATGDLADTIYLWRVIATDKAQNPATSDARTFVLDTILPEPPEQLTEITTGDEFRELFSWVRSVDPQPQTGTTGDESGVDFYNVVIIGPQEITAKVVDNATLCPASICTFDTIIDLIPGFYTIEVNAVDRAGNVGAAATADFRAGPLVAVQNLAVEAPVFVEPVLGSAVNTGNPTFSWNPPRELPLGLNTYEIAIPGVIVGFVPFTADQFFKSACFNGTGDSIGTGEACTAAIDTADKIILTVVGSGLLNGVVPDGTTALQVRVVDQKTLRGSAVPLTFTVDTTPPNVSTPLKTVPDNINVPSFTITTVDVHTQAVVFQRVHIESEAFIDVAVPDGPKLASPDDDVFTGDVTTFTWKQINTDISTVTYTLEIATGNQSVTGDFNNPVIREVSILQPVTTADVQFILAAGQSLATGDYLWHVRAVDRAGNIGDFSEVRRFTKDIDSVPPDQTTLLSPLNRSTGDDNTPEFTWSRVVNDVNGIPDRSGVRTYSLEVSLISGDSKQLVLTADGIVGTRFIIQEGQPPLATGDYEWRVSAVDRAGNQGARSDPSTFTILDDFTPPETPTLLFPGTGDVQDDATPTFVWSRVENDIAGRKDISGVKSFLLEIAIGTADFSPGNLAVAVFTPLTQFTVPQANALATGDYFWHVRAEDRRGNSGDFSVPFVFTIKVDVTAPEKPALLSPPNGSTSDDTTPTFVWSQVVNDINGLADRSGVGSYILDIRFVTGGGTTLAFTTGDIKGTQFTLPDNNALITTGDYLWRVRAVDKANNAGDFSDDFTITIVEDAIPPGVPTIISPATGATLIDATPTFVWRLVTGDISGVASYRLEIGTGGQTETGDFTNSVFTGDVPNVPVQSGDQQVVRFTLTQQNALASGDYVWHVRAVDGNGNIGDFSVRPKFNVFEDTVGPIAPVVLEPASGDRTEDATPTFTWVQVTGDVSGVAGYTIEIATGGQTETGDFANPVFTGDVPNVPVQSGGQQVIQFTLATGDALATGDYSWHVRAVDGSGNTGDFSAFSTFSVVADTTSPRAPILHVPATGDVTIDTTPTFVWEAVTGDISGVASYRLEIGTGGQTETGDFSSPVFTGDVSNVPVQSGDLQVVQFTLAAGDALATGDYTWHVRALDGAGNTGDFSVLSTFSVVKDTTGPIAPVLLAPASGDTGADPTPTFAWSPATDILSGVQSYTLEIATAPTGDFTNPLLTGDVLHTPVSSGNEFVIQFILPKFNALATGDYLWHVSAIDTSGNTGDFSTSFVLTIVEDKDPPGVPTLLTPASGDSALDRTPTFVWTAVTGDLSGVENYVLEIATAPTGDFTNPVFTGDVSLTPVNSGDELVIQFTLPENDALATGDYVWHVQAIDKAGNTGNFSDSSIFSVIDDTVPPGKPVLLTPASGDRTENRTPTFTWVQVTGDLTGIGFYILEISTGDFNATLFREVGITGDASIIQFTLAQINALDIGSYIWRVQAIDNAGNTGGFSEPFSFTVEDVTPPSAPTLLTPLSGAVTDDKTPSFTWTDVTDISGVSYILEVATGEQPLTGDFTTTVFRKEGILVTQFTLAIALATGDYLWHVRAVDSQGNTGDFSAPVTFKVQEDITRPGRPRLISPLNGSSGDDTTPLFTWTRVEDFSGVNYILEIASGVRSGTAGFTDSVFTADLPNVGVIVGNQLLIQFTISQANALAIGSFTWHVHAVDGLGNTGDFSDPFTFTVVPDTTPPGIPSLITPLGGTTADNARPNFAWTQVTDNVSPVTYSLLVDNNSDLASPDIRVTGLDVTSFKPKTQLPGRTFFWRVRAEDLAGNTADSEIGIFGVLGTPQELTMEPFPSRFGTVDYTPTFKWRGVPGVESYEVSLDDSPFVGIGTGDSGAATGDIKFKLVGITSGDVISFGPHHVIQVRAVVTGSKKIGGIATLFFSDNVATGSQSSPFVSTFTVDSGDFLPLGEHLMQVSATDRLSNTGDPKDAELVFKVSQLAISLQPQTQTVSPGTQATVVVQIEPRGLPVDGANISINFGPQLTLASIVTGSGITIFDIKTGVGTADFKASFTLLTGTEPPLSLANLVLNAVSVGAPNVVFETTGGRNTVGRFQGRDVPSVLNPATVRVNASPFAFASATPATVTEGDPVTFSSAGSFDPDGTIFSSIWTFGDGAAGAGATTTHVYAGAGTFTAILTVTDNDGATATAAASVTVEAAVVAIVALPPVAAAGLDLVVNEGTTVALDGTLSTDPNPEDIALLAFSWTQVSGPTVTLVGAITATPSFLAADNGVYSFLLTVSDPGALVASDTVDVTVNNVVPTVEAGDPQTLRKGLPVNISPAFTDPGIADTHVATVAWGDGNVDTFDPAVSPISATHNYLAGGIFTVNVTVTDDDGGVGTDSLIVTVQENKVPVANAGINQTVVEGATVLLDGSGSADPDGDIASYEWDLGDGSSGDGRTVAHIYPDNGVFTVTLRVTDNEGATGDATAIITVNNVLPRVATGDDQSVNEGETVEISNTFTEASPVDTHTATINWGDNTAPTTIDAAVSPVSASHVYIDNGTFIVTVNVTDDDGGVGVSQVTVTVANVTPVVDAGPGQAPFAGTPLTVAATFTDAGSGDTHTATFDWGDETVEPGTVTEVDGSGTVEGTHTYNAAGAFPVTLTVTDDDGAVATGSIEVVVLGAVGLIEGIEVREFAITPTAPIPPQAVRASFKLFNSTTVTVSLTPEIFVNGEVEFTFLTFTLPGGAESPTLVRNISRRTPGIFAVQVFD